MQERGELRTETLYGVTSLSAQRADASQLLELVRGQWESVAEFEVREGIGHFGAVF